MVKLLMPTVTALSVLLLASCVPSPASGCTKTHTVVWGDTCWVIGGGSNSGVSKLKSLNPGVNCDNLQIGAKLCISGGNAVQSPPLQRSPPSKVKAFPSPPSKIKAFPSPPSKVKAFPSPPSKIKASPSPPPSGVCKPAFGFKIESPYDLPVSDRYQCLNGVHTMKVKSGDSPFKTGSETAPRTEMRILNDYVSGTHSISFDLFVPSGTTGASLMQIFGGDSSYATSLQLRVYNGNLQRYNSQIVESNIYDRWMHLVVKHNGDSGAITVSVDQQLKLTTTQRGADNHYFKLGVYAQDGSSASMEARFKNIVVSTSG